MCAECKARKVPLSIDVVLRRHKSAQTPVCKGLQLVGEAPAALQSAAQCEPVDVVQFTPDGQSGGRS